MDIIASGSRFSLTFTHTCVLAWCQGGYGVDGTFTGGPPVVNLTWRTISDRHDGKHCLRCFFSLLWYLYYLTAFCFFIAAISCHNMVVATMFSQHDKQLLYADSYVFSLRGGMNNSFA